MKLKYYQNLKKDGEPENQIYSDVILGPNISLDDHNSDSSTESETNRLMLLNIMLVFY